jgi:hypothetical protein
MLYQTSAAFHQRRAARLRLFSIGARWHPRGTDSSDPSIADSSDLQILDAELPGKRS